MRILIGGAGGAPSNNFIKSLRLAGQGDHLIGMSSMASDLMLADVDERHVVPTAMSADYPAKLLKLVAATKPDFIHLQHDFEVRAVGLLRDQLHSLGVKTYLPSNQTIARCVDKSSSYEFWHKAGIRVPATVLVRTEEDLKAAFATFGPTIWLRATEGGGGKGALPANNYDFAKLWIDRFNGWGHFTAAELLTPRSVTWMSLWHEGELVVAQTRRRRSWNFGDRTLSGVTGITGVGETAADPEVDRISLESIRAIDDRPHGIFSVDLTYDQGGIPNPTEINIGRFFTTHYFFSRAGLNFPRIYCDIALKGVLPKLANKLNPLPNGLLWIRGMDVEPALVTAAELEALEKSST